MKPPSVNWLRQLPPNALLNSQELLCSLGLESMGLNQVRNMIDSGRLPQPTKKRKGFSGSGRLYWLVGEVRLWLQEQEAQRGPQIK